MLKEFGSFRVEAGLLGRKLLGSISFGEAPKASRRVFPPVSMVDQGPTIKTHDGVNSINGDKKEGEMISGTVSTENSEDKNKKLEEAKKLMQALLDMEDVDENPDDRLIPVNDKGVGDILRPGLDQAKLGVKVDVRIRNSNPDQLRRYDGGAEMGEYLRMLKGEIPI